MEPQKQSKIVGVLILCFVIIVVLCLLPLLILYIIFGYLYIFFNFLRGTKTIENKPDWRIIDTPSGINLNYKLGDFNELPPVIREYLKEAGLFIYKSDPTIEFFEGYFTDFKVERSDGLFVQKIIFDSTEQKILAAPVYFYKYSTGESKEIKDLRDYEIDSQGNPDDFIIHAFSEDHSIEIRLTK